MLIHLKPSNPRPISLFSTSQSQETSGEIGPQRSAEPTGAQGWQKGTGGIKSLLDCDRESLIVEFSPTQHTDLYLLIDDKLLVSLKQLLQECSHVELQPTSLIRIYFTGCYLQDWVGQNTHYSVKLGFSYKTLKGDNVSSESCPHQPATSGPHLQFPQLTCGLKDVIVKLPANELKYTQIIAPVVLAIAVTPTDPMELVDQFANTFSSTPELTNLVHLEIKTPPGVVVRQQPFLFPNSQGWSQQGVCQPLVQPNCHGIEVGQKHSPEYHIG
ncbi:hypothetical protein KOW79_012686 [Hemibagrus wyckioides]|uniref:Uncharacterized protein n=1 Tax=Hemibagrus wyckioides TaxID=337641 RepID=A0A9D3NM80_9TELE|nr:hypothetical protein KOW79_012686 [Hemibagrus wyckioides]